jgi:23S rRNA (pseudouridine1915-N3)-methyltransferase
MGVIFLRLRLKYVFILKNASAGFKISIFFTNCEVNPALFYFMKWSIVTVGKPALPWARDAAADYLRRVSRWATVECKVVRDGDSSAVAKRMLEASEDSWRVILDEKGRMNTSASFAKWIETQNLSGRKRVSILIGGADGHTDEVRAAADEVWSLSAMTLQHELALVLFLEQLYRGYSILNGAPYHRP